MTQYCLLATGEENVISTFEAQNSMKPLVISFLPDHHVIFFTRDTIVGEWNLWEDEIKIRFSNPNICALEFEKTTLSTKKLKSLLVFFCFTTSNGRGSYSYGIDNAKSEVELWRDTGSFCLPLLKGKEDISDSPAVVLTDSLAGTESLFSQNVWKMPLCLQRLAPFIKVIVGHC